MGLLSIFKREAGSGPSAPRNGATSAADTADAVLLARTRARQRLIGAAVLLLIGVIGFPIVFETQPRPVAVNVPIEVPAKDGGPALAMPASKPAAATPASAVAAASAKPADPVITETSEEGGRDVTPPASAAKSTANSGAKPAAEATSKVASVQTDAEPAAKPPAPAKPEPKAKPAAEKPAPAAASTKVADAARAKALLDGDATAAAATPAPAKADGGSRFVVQLGAFSDNASAHEVRVKAEKHGIKTFAQVVDTAKGKRYRVRMGPFASREEADKALAKVRASGLDAAVLTL